MILIKKIKIKKKLLFKNVYKVESIEIRKFIKKINSILTVINFLKVSSVQFPTLSGSKIRFIKYHP
jgi:hypothetical protein